MHSALQLTDDELVTLARNSFEASFIDDGTKQRYYAEIAATPAPRLR
jgi:adenosine deaminase